MSRRLISVVFPAVLLVVTSPSVAAPPQFSASVTGIELAPQSIAGAAIFFFNVNGQIDGKQQKGFGWIAINHEELPVVLDESSAILGGTGTIYVGYFRRYSVTVTGGELILTDTKGTPEFDDAFEVSLDVDICRNGECGSHQFAGLLDHGPFPPTIAGPLFVAP